MCENKFKSIKAKQNICIKETCQSNLKQLKYIFITPALQSNHRTSLAGWLCTPLVRVGHHLSRCVWGCLQMQDCLAHIKLGGGVSSEALAGAQLGVFHAGLTPRQPWRLPALCTTQVTLPYPHLPATRIPCLDT